MIFGWMLSLNDRCAILVNVEVIAKERKLKWGYSLEFHCDAVRFTNGPYGANPGLKHL